ncbi:MAG: aminoglycoside phosphotransferase family protein [Microbacteriaceae bacterium]|nr:aminoglycoside phosphotransferase family protein [Microbacteriaceae bacterium]MCL2794040.1 aminoglycoside phosphotransferase family protein [Microbacteriaceae bacterium]
MTSCETGTRMHAHQIDVTASDVRRLLSAQFPQWAGESVMRLPSYGTTNAMFKLGDDKVARLPFIPGDGASIAVEAGLLAHVAGALPVPTPRVLEVGEPDGAYPFHWSVLSWLPGEMPVPESLVDASGLVDDVVDIVLALQRMPVHGARTAQRSAPFCHSADEVRGYLAQLAGDFDTRALSRLWNDALAAPAWDGPPMWLHSDLLPSNLLVDERGRLCGVLDWAAAGVGDPSCELLAAWNVFPADARELFRARLGVDEASWRRGRGWAVSQASHALAYYRETNPGMVEMATRALRALELEEV